MKRSAISSPNACMLRSRDNDRVLDPLLTFRPFLRRNHGPANPAFGLVSVCRSRKLRQLHNREQPCSRFPCDRCGAGCDCSQRCGRFSPRVFHPELFSRSEANRRTCSAGCDSRMGRRGFVWRWCNVLAILQASGTVSFRDPRAFGNGSKPLMFA
jgi:hypothetical protein